MHRAQQPTNGLECLSQGSLVKAEKQRRARLWELGSDLMQAAVTLATGQLGKKKKKGVAGLWDAVWEAHLRRSPPTVYRAALIALGVAMGRKTPSKNVC